jgi:hypothetical protein
MQAPHSWKTVSIYPWVGDRFESPTVLPYPTLFLGESHYCQPDEFCSDLTIRCILSHIEKQEAWNKYWTKIRRIALGASTTVTAEVFWRSAAFYNFVQFPAGDSARVRPTPQMWLESAPAFQEVFCSLRPSRILVLGKVLWDFLQDYMTMEQISSTTSALYHGEHQAILGYVGHPSSFGFSYSKWNHVASAVLGLDVDRLRNR